MAVYGAPNFYKTSSTKEFDRPWPDQIRPAALADAFFQDRAELLIYYHTCPFRKSYPGILVVQPGQDWDGDNDTGPLDRARRHHFLSLSLGLNPRQVTRLPPDERARVRRGNFRGRPTPGFGPRPFFRAPLGHRYLCRRRLPLVAKGRGRGLQAPDACGVNVVGPRDI